MILFFDTVYIVNSKNRKTLEAIFHRPTRPDIAWSEIESLFKAVGADITEGSGSRVRVALNGTRYVYHRPHADRKTIKGAVETVREQLVKAGIIQ
jgi:hypothetical protein